MAVSLSKDGKSEVKEEVKKESIKDDIKSSDLPEEKSTASVESGLDPLYVITQALITVKTKMEAQPHKHKEKILTKLKGAIELLSQN